MVVDIVKYFLYLFRNDIKCDENLGNNVKVHLEYILKPYFQHYFLLKLSQNNLILGFPVKKPNNVFTIYF
jgi:hypothetical protein